MQSLLLFHGNSGYTKAHVTCICAVHCLSVLTPVFGRASKLCDNSFPFLATDVQQLAVLCFLYGMSHFDSQAWGAGCAYRYISLHFSVCCRNCCPPSRPLCVEPFDCLQKRRYLNQKVIIACFRIRI